MINKVFNVTGVCIPEKHYMADTGEKLKEITTKFIEPGNYFTINCARQYGKTTTLYLLEQSLKEQYVILRLSFESADDLFVSRYTFASGLVRQIGKQLRQMKVDEGIQAQWNMAVSREFPMEDLSDKISCLCRSCKKKVVLMIDEADKSSDNQIFLSFLGMLRKKYLEQQQGMDISFHSVILTGVYDVKNLKLKLHPEEETKYNSPWNIAADFCVDMSLSIQEIAGMLTEYEKDHSTGMDIQSAAQEIYAYTSGYPYLVSRLCKRIAEDVGKTGSSIKAESVWSKEGIIEAVKLILCESNTLFDDMYKKIADSPQLKDMLRKMLFQGQSFAYNPDHPVIDIGVMFGLMKRENDDIVVSNRIFETRLYNYFLSEEMLDNQTYLTGLRYKEQFIHGGILDMELILRKFVEHFTEIYRDYEESFVEENGRRLFLLYLKPVINGVGNYYIESRTRDMGRTDIIVDYLGRQYIIETKIFAPGALSIKAYENGKCVGQVRIPPSAGGEERY